MYTHTRQARKGESVFAWAPNHGDAASPDSCPVSKRLLEGPRANGASLEVKLAFNPFRHLPSDALYLHSRVTLCDKQAGRPCLPVSGQQ